MIRVKKISHAIYETPDLVRQTEYYTDVLGLTRIDKGDGAVYLGKQDRSPFGRAEARRARALHHDRFSARARRRSRHVREAGRRPRHQGEGRY